MTRELLRVWVPGRPRTKGSLEPVHVRGTAGRPCRVGLRESGRYSVAWKKTIMKFAAQAWERRPPLAGAVRIDSEFRFERLCLPDREMPWPTREQGEYAHGDEDKLRRNVLDALTQAHVLADDSLSVGGMTLKRWCREGEGPGVLVIVSEAGDPLAWPL